MIKNKIFIRCIFLAATVVVLGSAYGLAKRSGMLDPVATNTPAATDPWKILQQIHEYYQRDSVIAQTFHIRLYSEKEPAVSLEKYECIYYAGRGQVYSKLGAGETWCDKDMLVTTDLDAKVMQVMASQPELLASNIPALKDLKKMVNTMQGQLSVIEENGKQVLLYKSEFDTEIKSYRVYFDPLTWAINSVKMEVWKEDAFLQKEPEPLTMEIQFSPMKILNDFPEKFGRNRFVHLKTDSLLLSDEYLDFELINQLNISVK